MAKRILKLIFLCIAPVILVLMALAFVCNDLVCYFRRWLRRTSAARRGASPPNSSLLKIFEPPRTASLVVLNWNGKELLEKYLPSVLAACGPSDEVIVVDNASTDGSADFVRQAFPAVRVLSLDRNLGFGGGATAGISASRNSVAVLLNNDMRVAPDFLPPLLAGFSDPDVFAVSAQIFFPEPGRRREETGLTAGRFEKGFVRVRHEIEDRIADVFPTFYAGGGSTAYDREKFLALGGFDRLFEPFYLEDADISYCAWRKGWKVLYQPRSHVYHQHRATIGRHYSPQAIRAYLQKNYVLMVWKNIHRWRWMLSHFLYLYGHMALCSIGRETETRTSVGAFLFALRSLPAAMTARRKALLRFVVNDDTAFARVRPSVFRETFHAASRSSSAPGEAPGTAPLNILFVSPYSIYPALHGGAVLMLEAIRELAKRHNIFVLMFVDSPAEAESNRGLEGIARKVETYQRRPHPRGGFSIRSHAQQVFFDPQFADLLDRMVLLHDIDLIQFEYTQLAQYRLPLRHTPQCLFEHDVYFRSVQRQLFSTPGGVADKSEQTVEWLRALRYEVSTVQDFDAVFLCHDKERLLLESLMNSRRPAFYAGVRTAVDVASYHFPGGPREADSLLFVGNFQHRPNVDGLEYFCSEILPLIRSQRPQVRLTAVGARPPLALSKLLEQDGIELLGQVPDIRQPLSRHSVFVCPIRTGAGVRVKILEAFASGIPVVSTLLGAEGLEATHGDDLLIAANPLQFASAVLGLLQNSAQAARLAQNARRLVELAYDWTSMGNKLDRIYTDLVSHANSGGDAAQG